MKHEYFVGDNDYVKFGLLQSFPQSGFVLGVLWMLTLPYGWPVERKIACLTATPVATTRVSRVGGMRWKRKLAPRGRCVHHRHFVLTRRQFVQERQVVLNGMALPIPPPPTSYTLAPIVAGVTATAGSLVFTGDMAGTLYAFDT